MLQKFFHPQPQDDASKEQNGENFESDTQKIVRRHLEDEDHVITEDEVRNIRIGMTPPPDAPTEEAIREREEKLDDTKTPDENETSPVEQQATPWDVIETDG